MKQTYENHHVIPLCLEGFDWKENIVSLTTYEHKLVHMTLDIPYSKIRAFRKKTNHLVHRNSQSYVSLLRGIHLDFFKNSNLLPIKIQNQLRDCIRETTKRIIRESSLTLKTPKDNEGIMKWLNSLNYALILR